MSANYNLFYFFKQFPDEEACRKYLEKQRLGDTPVCPHCGNTHIPLWIMWITLCITYFHAKNGLFAWG